MVRMNGFQILKIIILNVGTCKFAVLRLTLNPVKNFLKYDGEFMSDEKALQVGRNITKIRAGLIVITRIVRTFHFISFYSRYSLLSLM